MICPWKRVSWREYRTRTDAGEAVIATLREGEWSVALEGERLFSVPQGGSFDDLESVLKVVLTRRALRRGVKAFVEEREETIDLTELVNDIGNSSCE